MAKWQTSPLASVCTVFGDGDWIESKDQSPDGVRLVQTGNVGEGVFKDRGEKARFVSEDTFTRLRCTEIFAGDCLISRLPDPVGRACLIPETGDRMITAVDCTIVRFDKSKVLPEFFAYYSQASHYLAAVEREATGTTRKRISRARLGQVAIPLPPLPTQQRIVAILDEAFEGIATAKANAEKNLRNARGVLNNHLRSVFSVPRDGRKAEPLRNIAKSCLGKMLDKAKNKGELHAYLRNLNVRWFNFDLTDLQKMRFTADELERYSVRRGDVVICEGGYPGRAAIWQDDEPVYFQKALHRVRFDNPVLARWFLYFLYSEEESGMLRQHFTGTGIQHFTGAALSNLVVPLAPQAAMDAHVDAFDALSMEVERLEAIYRSKLTALEELKKSLLHQAFSGRLVSQKKVSRAQRVALQTATPEFTANVISLAYARHERQKRERTFGHVKEQKILHLIESLAGVELGRQPMRDAAGPNDFQHMRNAEKWAKAQSFFDMVKNGEGYEFRKLSDFDQHMSRARLTLEPYLTRIEPVIDLLVPMDTEDAEVFTTVHAAWSNLVIDGLPTTDDAIVYAARDGWHPDKLKIPEHKFRSAIEMIRRKKLEPDGSAKYVGGQQPLL